MLELFVKMQAAIIERLRLIREDGATAVEYGLIVGLMTLTLIIGANRFSTTVNKSYNVITNSIASAVG